MMLQPTEPSSQSSVCFLLIDLGAILCELEIYIEMNLGFLKNLSTLGMHYS